MQIVNRFTGYAARILLFVCAFYGICELFTDFMGKTIGFTTALVVFLFAEYKDHETELKN